MIGAVGLLSADELLDHYVELQTLFAEALGDHQALAEVRREIALQMDAVEAELVSRGLAVPEAD